MVTQTTTCDQHIFIDLGSESIYERLGDKLWMKYIQTRLVCDRCHAMSWFRSNEPVIIRGEYE